MCENLKKIHCYRDFSYAVHKNKLTDGQTPTITQPLQREEEIIKHSLMIKVHSQNQKKTYHKYRKTIEIKKNLKY